MLTPWYSPSTPPARRGYYDTRTPARGSIRMSNHLGSTSMRRVTTAEIRLFWTGRVWVASRKSPEYSFSLWNQHREWRGLTACYQVLILRRIDMKSKADKHREAGTLAAFKARQAASRAGTARHQATPFITRAKTDAEFMKAWNASGRQYGDHELENVYLGWRMREAAFSHEKTLDDA